MVHQGVDQRARPVTGSGMYHEPLRLVEDKQVFVLIDDVQREILRLQGDFRGGGELQLQLVAGTEPGVFFDGLAVDCDAAFVQKPLSGAASEPISQPGQGAVGSLTVATAVAMRENGDDGIPVPYYTEDVSNKVVKIIQSYTAVVNKMVWRKG